MKHLKLLAIYLLLALLASCFGGGAEIPQDHYYRLAEISGHVQPQGKPLFDTLAVATLKSDDLHKERAILYSNANQPLHLLRYHYHHWHQVPGQLIQEHMIDYFSRAGLARRVARYGEATRVDANITGYIKRFERVINGGQVLVSAELELHLQTMQSPRRYVQGNYSLEIKVVDSAMHNSVQALSEALEQIYTRFVNDIKNQQLK